jgi:hypothetical protein
MKTNYACPCCSFLTLEEEPPGTYDISPLCFWEDDPVQFKDLDYKGGANKISLRSARQNYRLFGAKDNDHIEVVRKPKPSEIPKSSE